MAWRVHRKDKNQNEIVYVLDKLGLSVYDLSQVGGGMADIIVAYNGINFLFEIKTEKGRLNATQKEFHSKWQGSIAVIKSPYDAIACLKLYFNSKRFDRLSDKWIENIPKLQEEYHVTKPKRPVKKRKISKS
jgi:hypothetical protein